MNLQIKKACLTAFVPLTIFAMFSVPAKANRSADLAHSLVRAKILREASRRYKVQFLTTHTDKFTNGEFIVTGKGRIFVRNKGTQLFVYESTVNPRSGRDHDTKYHLK